MPPQYPYQPTPQSDGTPQQPLGPHQAPHYGYGGAGAQHFQPQVNGSYEVLPALQPMQNNGHSGHNPYEFIVNPNTNKSARSTGLFTGGDVMFKRMAILGGGVVLLIIIVWALLNAFTPKGSTPGMTSIAERQQELIRVSTAATQQATSQDGQDLAYNVKFSITTDQQQTVAFLKSHGTKVGTKTLALDQSSTTDSQLANAATANNYDGAFAQNIVSQLQDYESLIKTTYGQTTSKDAHTLLQQQYADASLLLKQATNVANEFNNN